MKLRISTFIIISSALLNMAFGQQKTGEITSVVENKLIHQNGFLPVDINEKALLKAFSNKSESVELPYLNELRPFKLVQFSIYPGDANPHPEIKTYKLYSKTDKTISGRVTTGPGGINIMYLTKGKMIRIYPDHYEANKSRNYVQEVGIGTKVPEGEKYCTVHESHYSPRPLSESSIKNVKETLKRNGSIRRIYRVAVMCTGEYAELNGGGARQLMISNLSDISAIYEKDMSFELEMAIGAPRVNSDRDTDPFIPANGNRPGQAQDAISAAFPVSRYDIGHVFHRSSSGDGWDSGGVAGLGVICNASRKASGWSGSSNNTSNSWIQLAAHEFGHMFDSPHTFNGDGSSCEEGNHPINTAYEIGSGTTIMSYQGICASEYNIPASGVADNYFHVNSLNRMVDYAENFGICNDENWIVDNNNEPVANANPCGATFSIPRLTPFMMIGEATDADGDALTYNWEQYDEDGTGQRPTHGLIGSQAADSNTAPLYRSYPPNSSPIRVIPTLDNLRNNISSPFEVLTRRSRDINFRFVVRDNNPVGGAIDWDQIKIRTTATKGPLSLTSPENSEIVQAGSELEVTWNTRNSDDLCEKAVIRLSVDGGLSFPFDIAKDIDYAAGSAMVVIPASFSNTEQARIMIACDDYECFTFFDITNRNFSIESNCFAPGSLLCDDSDGTYLFGAPELDFDEDVMDGTSVTSITGPLEALETIDLTINDINNNCTIVNGINNPYQAFNFSVTLGGSYKFTIDDSIDGALTAYTIFDGDTFNPLNPCNSFIASNANWVANSYGYFLEFDVVLEPCKNYILVATVTNSMSSDLSLVDVEGPGLFIVSNLTADYELTFLAFDANTEVITAVSADADFTTLAAGEYYIKSAYYKVSGPTPPNNVDPTTLIGLTESELLGGIDCILPSGNEKEIIIEASCFVNDIIEVSRTTCDPLTNTYDITLSFTVDMGPETGMVTINGQAFPLSGTDATVTLTDLVSNGEFVDLDFVFSDDQGCNRVYEDVFQAPMNCCPITIELGQDRTLCAGDIEVLDGGTDGIMYEWFKDGEATGDDTQTIEVTEEGEYSVLVTNSTGCVNQEAVFLDFAPLPSVELSETEIDACIGQIVEVEVTTNVNNIEWFYEGTSVSVDQVILEVSEPGNYSVVVTSMFGCTNTATFSAVFKDSPEIDIGDDILTCNGSVITLDAGLSGPQYLYEWKRNFIQNVGTDQTTDIVTFGTYSVTVTDTNNGCESLDTIGVDYEPLPEFDFGRDKTRCEGDFYVIEAEESAFEIEWYFNDELIVGENDIELTAMEQGEYVGIVNQNSQCIESDTLFVTYLDAPDVDFPDMISACPGEIIDLVVDDLNATFIWSSEADGVLPNITNSLSVTTSGTYYVAASSTTTFCPANDTIVVNFSEVPELDLGEDVTGCEGTPVILSSETNGFMVDWYFNNQIIVGANTSTLEVTQAGEYRISIDEGGTCVSEDIVNVTFAPSPTVNLGDDPSACPGDVVVLDAGDPSATY
ncbi:MAG: zinc-dependent metalloprotease, partial [Bacteroidia bacterium]|nr:zinc-dependent metalloprotease [Bacteroidia bacterium]